MCQCHSSSERRTALGRARSYSATARLTRQTFTANQATPVGNAATSSKPVECGHDGGIAESTTTPSPIASAYVDELKVTLRHSPARTLGR